MGKRARRQREAGGSVAAAGVPGGASPSPASEADKNRNLTLRFVTAFGLLPAVFFFTWQGGIWFAGFIGLCATLAALEYYEMSLGRDPLKWLGALTVFGGHLLVADPARVPLAGLLLPVLFAVTTALRLFRNAPPDSAPNDVAKTVSGAAYLLLPATLVLLRADGGAERDWSATGWVWMAFTVTWFVDTGAYFSGRFLGKNKLFPRISPAKTWEGFFGGMATAILGALGVRALLLPDLTALDCVALGALGCTVGHIGDLSESMFKRAFKRKDSGNLLPGHGGMLDRIDAVILNAPMVWAYVHLVVTPRG